MLCPDLSSRVRLEPEQAAYHVSRCNGGDDRARACNPYPRTDGPEEAGRAVAELLDVGEAEAAGIVELRLLRFTKHELDVIRAESDSLRKLLGMAV